MEKARIEWHGDHFIVAAEVASDDVTRWGAQKILKDARRFCPVGTMERAPKTMRKSWTGRSPGTLKNSIKIKKSKYSGYIISAGDYNAYYARFVELGTPGKTYQFGARKGEARIPVKAKPFIRQAKEANEMSIHIKFRNRIDKITK